MTRRLVSYSREGTTKNQNILPLLNVPEPIPRTVVRVLQSSVYNNYTCKCKSILSLVVALVCVIYALVSMEIGHFSLLCA